MLRSFAKKKGRRGRNKGEHEENWGTFADY